jgi:hypothetical protein
MPNQEIQYTCDSAIGEIHSAVSNIIDGAINSAVNHAIEIGADGFIDEIQILENSDGIYQISTHSGILDYSIEEKQMLPALLSNAKTSKDGSKYKVIPIRDKGTPTPRSSFSVSQLQQDGIDESRAALRDVAASKRLGITDTLKANLSKQAADMRAAHTNHSDRTGTLNFRTATDKQDPSTAWVIPRKEIDMTDFISDLNRQIDSDSRESTTQILNNYYYRYVGV